MSLRLVQEGERGGDVVIVYHLSLDDALRAAAPGAWIFVEVLPAMKGLYATPTPVSEAVTIAGGARRVILAGFSEGCQGVRAQLLAGDVPSAALAIDGIHASDPPNMAKQIDPWIDYRNRAIAGEVVFFVSHSSIHPGKFLSTTQTAKLLRSEGLHPVESIAGGETEADGLFFLDAFPGTDADAHRFQGREVLPAALRFVLAGAPVVPVRAKLSRRVKIAVGSVVAAALGWLGYQLAR